RYLHHVGVPAPGGSLSLRRAGAAAPATGARPAAHTGGDQHRTVRRDHRQRGEAAWSPSRGETGSAAPARSPRMSPRPASRQLSRWLIERTIERLGPWLLPIVLIAMWETAARLELIPARILPAPSHVAVAFWETARSGALLYHIGI